MPPLFHFDTDSTLTPLSEKVTVSAGVPGTLAYILKIPQQFSDHQSLAAGWGSSCWLDGMWESHLLCFTGLQQYPPALWFARGRGLRHTPEA